MVEDDEQRPEGVQRHRATIGVVILQSQKPPSCSILDESGVKTVISYPPVVPSAPQPRRVARFEFC